MLNSKIHSHFSPSLTVLSFTLEKHVRCKKINILLHVTMLKIILSPLLTLYVNRGRSLCQCVTIFVSSSYSSYILFVFPLSVTLTNMKLTYEIIIAVFYSRIGYQMLS